MTANDSLAAAMDSHLASLAGPPTTQKPEQSARPSLDEIVTDMAAALRKSADDRAAKACAEAERQAALKAARDYQAGERGRQLLREYEARQAALAKPAQATAPAPAPASNGQAAAKGDAPAPAAPVLDRARQGLRAIFAAAFGREPADESEIETEFNRARERELADGPTKIVFGSGQMPSLLAIRAAHSTLP